jgi:hypothetical protein
VPDVTGNFDLPDGGAPYPAQVRVRLAGAQGLPILGIQISTGREIVGETVLTQADGIEADGSWSVPLVGQGDISPEGTTWRIERRLPSGIEYVTFHTVPVTGGPYAAYTLEDDPLGAIASSALSAHAAKRGIGGHIPEGGADGYVLTRDTDPSNQFGVLWAAGGGGGGGGAVDSVNGQAGTVVLGPEDLSPAAPTETEFDTHVALQGSAGAHLPSGGTPGQVPIKGSGGAVAWGNVSGAGSTDAAAIIAALPVIMLWNSTTSVYDAPPQLAVLGLTPATAAYRIWIGPDDPGDVDGGAEDYYEEKDLFILTGSL